MAEKLKKIFPYLAGLCTGLLNGLFGAGGGMVAVPLLQSMGVKDQRAHATSLSLILPLSVISCFFYLKNGAFAIEDSLIFLLPGIAGAVVGAIFLKKVNPIFLRAAFGLLLLYAGGRLLLT